MAIFFSPFFFSFCLRWRSWEGRGEEKALVYIGRRGERGGMGWDGMGAKECLALIATARIPCNTTVFGAPLYLSVTSLSLSSLLIC